MTLDARALSLVFSRALGKVIVDVHGPLDANTAHQLKDRLVDVIDGQGNLQLVLDLKGMTHVDAVGLWVLVDALKRMQRTGGELVLSGLTRHAARALEAAGLDKYFVITPSWAHPACGNGQISLGRPAGWAHRG